MADVPEQCKKRPGVQRLVPVEDAATLAGGNQVLSYLSDGTPVLKISDSPEGGARFSMLLPAVDSAV